MFNHLEHPFDVIGISETKLSDSSKINDLLLSGYTLHHQPTKSFCGGAAIYVNNKLDHFLRNNLSVCQKEFETICTEIKHYDTEHRETSKELVRVYSETHSKKDWTLANIQ